MNRIFGVASLLFAAIAGHAADPSSEEKIKSIRAQYTEIENELKGCRQVQRDLPDESAEGGELTAWFKGSSLRKLSARFFGETGKALEEYYFANDNRLIFVLRIETHYTKPMSGVVKNKTEQRFYFADGKLIRWLNQQNKDVTGDAAAAKYEREFLAAAKKYSAMANQER